MGGEQRFEQVVGQRLAGLVVLGEGLQHAGVPDPVLEHLRGQLDEVQGGRGAGERAVVHLGEQVVQSVAELVEERLDVLVHHERGLVGRRRREVADHRDHRLLHGAVVPDLAREEAEAGEVLVLVVARVRVEVEGAEHLVAGLVPNLVALDVGVPEHAGLGGGGLRDVANLDAVERLGDVEEALDDALHREVFLHLLGVDGVLVLHQPVLEVELVPDVHLGVGVAGQLALGGLVFVEVDQGLLADERAQLLVELQHRLRLFDHSNLGLVRRLAGIAEQLGLLGAQHEHALQQLDVPPAALALVLDVHLLAGGFVLAEVLDGGVRGGVDAGEVHVAAVRQPVDHVRGHARQLGGGQGHARLVVADVLLEFQGELGFLQLKLLELVTLLGRQLHAAAAKVA